jgi:hypothetical protein
MNPGLSETVLELLLAEGSKDPGDHRWKGGVVIGVLAGFDDEGRPRIELPDGWAVGTLSARSIVRLNDRQIGRELVLTFEGGDQDKPIVLGLVQEMNRVTAAPMAGAGEVELDEERLILSATREVVLRCGEASITLTRAGKILIRGAYVLSRSAGVNRIKGGSVQIN